MNGENNKQKALTKSLTHSLTPNNQLKQLGTEINPESLAPASFLLADCPNCTFTASVTEKATLFIL